LQTKDGSEQKVAAQVVVDATGQQSLIANALGIRRVNPDLKKSAIWNYYRGARREPGLHGGATVILLTESKQSWFWYIPLSDDITSIGVVGDTDRLLKSGETPEKIFERELAACSALGERLTKATPTAKFRVAREFSYSVDQPAGDGWVLVGDAWGFIDPIYSSGVYFALKSGELAADCIVEGLRSGNMSAAQLGRWCEPFTNVTNWIRRLVTAFYNDDFSFGRFIKDHPEHLGNLTDLLIGRIFDPRVGAIFEDMDRWLAETVEAKNP
jgi:flavin-dependent dehydrogenase